MPFTVGKFAYWFTIGMVATIAWQERKNLKGVLCTYRELRWPVLWRGAVLAIGTAGLAALSVWLAPEPLLWGWPSLFGERVGNVLISPVVPSGPAPTPFSGPIPPAVLTLLGLMVTAMLFFLALLFFIMPGVVNTEERMFRKGVDTTGGMLWNSFLFGASHLIIGIPIVIAVVLMAPGMVLGLTYRQSYRLALSTGHSDSDAMLEGTRASGHLHLAYNSTILGSIALSLIVVLLLALLGVHP